MFKIKKVFSRRVSVFFLCISSTTFLHGFFQDAEHSLSKNIESHPVMILMREKSSIINEKNIVQKLESLGLPFKRGEYADSIKFYMAFFGNNEEIKIECRSGFDLATDRKNSIFSCTMIKKNPTTKKLTDIIAGPTGEWFQDIQQTVKAFLDAKKKKFLDAKKQ